MKILVVEGKTKQQLMAKSEYDKGSEFTFILPLRYEGKT